MSGDVVEDGDARDGCARTATRAMDARARAPRARTRDVGERLAHDDEDARRCEAGKSDESDVRAPTTRARKYVNVQLQAFEGDGGARHHFDGFT